MAFWNRTRSLEQRFPPDRLAAIPILIVGAAGLAAAKHGNDRTRVHDTKFFLGYLAGFTDFLDHVDQRLSGAIRKFAFDQIWGVEKGQVRFSQAVLLLHEQDEPTKRGFGFGVPDGNRYFGALEEGRSAEGALTGLEAAFDLEMVDFAQKLS